MLICMLLQTLENCFTPKYLSCKQKKIVAPIISIVWSVNIYRIYYMENENTAGFFVLNFWCECERKS